MPTSYDDRNAADGEPRPGATAARARPAFGWLAEGLHGAGCRCRASGGDGRPRVDHLVAFTGDRQR